MAEPKLSAARQWLNKAKRDMAAAERLISHERPLLDIGVYHCQQAVEKALKAFLTYHEIPFEKTHNLVALLDVATRIDSDFQRWLETAKTLTPYATEFRYPGELFRPDPEEASRALQDSESFLRFLTQRLPAKPSSAAND